MGEFNGNGVFVRTYSWQNDANSGILIRSDRMDTEDNGFATGLSNVICRDGQTTITANIPMSNFRFTTVADAQNKNEFITVNQVMNGYGPYSATVSGTANAITLGFSPGYAAYTAGMKVSFIASNSNSGATTVTIDALTSKAITKNGTTALVGGEIISGTMYTLQYDGTEFQIINPTLASYIPTAGGTFTGTVIMSGAAINEAQGTDIASATTTNIGAATGNYVKVTGTTTITAFDTVQAGTKRTVTFTGALTLTYNATNLILKGGANIVTAAGDTAEFVSLGSGNWVNTNYNRASGQPLIVSPYTPSFTSSGQTIFSGNGSYSVAHGLSARPTFMITVLRCITNDNGYVVGDEVNYSLFDDATTGALYSGYNATTCFASQNSLLRVVNKSTLGFTNITPASWNLVFKAFL